MPESHPSPPTPRLSIVLAATQPWPAAKLAVDSLYEQALAVGAEIIVADGCGQGAPPVSQYPVVRRLTLPGASVFQLRASALAVSRGAIVAVTEDHCRVAPDWCQRILTAHREYPQADMIGGAVENGADRFAIDWANFLIANDRFLPPLSRGEQSFIAGQANVTYKRRALPTPYPPEGIDEGSFRRALQARGGKLYSDDRIRVWHVQSLGVWGSCIVHFHDGRTLAGVKRARLSTRRWAVQLVKMGLLPVRVLLNAPRIALRTAWDKGAYCRPALRSLPWLGLVLCFHYAGELVGHLAGPGNSPHRLR
jgi:hypothetical protein